MIYTVTFNPSLDYVVKVDAFAVGEINRTQVENIYPGGKGINVSLVLQNLGLQSVALGFTAGFSGTEIERLLHKQAAVAILFGPVKATRALIRRLFRTRKRRLMVRDRS